MVHDVDLEKDSCKIFSDKDLRISSSRNAKVCLLSQTAIFTVVLNYVNCESPARNRNVTVGLQGYKTNKPI